MKHVPTLSSILLFVALVGFTNVDYQSNLLISFSGWLQVTSTPPPPILEGTALQTDRTNLPVATVTSFLPLGSPTTALSIPSVLSDSAQSVSATPTDSVQTDFSATYQTERINPLNVLILNVTDAELVFIRNDQLRLAFAQLDQQKLTDIADALDRVVIPTPQLAEQVVLPTDTLENDEVEGSGEPVVTATVLDEASLEEDGTVLDSVNNQPTSTDEAVTDEADLSTILVDLTGDELAQLEPLTLARILISRPIAEVSVIISDLPYDVQLTFLEKIDGDFSLDLPTPSREPSPSPAPSNTPAPTPIPPPTATFTPTEIIPPSATFTVTDRPLPTQTSEPTQFVPTMTYTVTARSLPTNTPPPTQLVISPTYTVSPAYQASRTFTPSPVPLPTATRVPTLIPTPSPTRSS